MSRVLGIIVAYQHKDIAQICLDEAVKQNYGEIDWVVWNNGGVRGLTYNPQLSITVHHSPTNLLWTPALNAAIEMYLKPEHTHILYMNHDIRLGHYTVIEMVTFLEENADAGAVGPVGSSMGGLQDFVSNKDNYQGQKAIRSAYLMGAIQMMKREVWDIVGPFDNSMPLGADDFDYSIRMKEAGYSLWVLPGVYVDHVGHVTGKSPEWNEYGGKSWTRFNEKYDMYYATEAEAIGSLWNGTYNEEYPVGTGIAEEEKIKRGIRHAP